MKTVLVKLFYRIQKIVWVIGFFMMLCAPASAYLTGECFERSVHEPIIKISWKKDQHYMNDKFPSAVFRDFKNQVSFSWREPSADNTFYKQKFQLILKNLNRGHWLEVDALYLGPKDFKKDLFCRLAEVVPEVHELNVNDTGLIATYDKETSGQLAEKDKTMPFLLRMQITKNQRGEFRTSLRGYMDNALKDSTCSQKIQTEVAFTHAFLGKIVTKYDKLLETNPSSAEVIEEREKIEAMGHFLIQALQSARDEGEACFQDIARIHLINSLSLMMDRNQSLKNVNHDALLGGAELQLLTYALLTAPTSDGGSPLIQFFTARDRANPQSPLSLRTEAGSPAVTGFYNCQNRRIHLDAELSPADLSGLLLHELTHFFFDISGPSMNPDLQDFDSRTLLLIDESLAAVTAAFFQKALRVQAGEIVLPQEAKTLNPLATFFNPLGVFATTFENLRTGEQKINLQRFMSETFLASRELRGSSGFSQSQEMIRSTFSHLANSHFQFDSETDREKLVDSASNKILSKAFYPVQEQVEGRFTLNVNSNGQSIFSKLKANTIYYLDARSGLMHESNLSEAYAWLNSVVTSAHGEPSAQCQSLEKAAQHGDLKGYLGLGVVADGLVSTPGRGSVMPGRPTVMPGRGSVMPSAAPIRLCIHSDLGI